MYPNERYVINGLIYDLNGLKLSIPDEFQKMTVERCARKLQDLVDDADFYAKRKEEKND